MSNDSRREQIEALERSRTAIESAIFVLKLHRGNMTEGQIKEVKKIIYYPEG